MTEVAYGNVRKLVVPIFETLGLDPLVVRSITVTPEQVTAEIYLLNENGAKYVDLDKDAPAIETRTFEVIA